MKLSSAAVALLANAIPSTFAAEECVVGAFELEFEGSCTPETVLEAYADQVFHAAGGTAPTCALSAEASLASKLAAAGLSTAQDLCDQVYKTQPKEAFTDAANRGTDITKFEQMFFNGLTDWQDEVETLYETDDDTRSSYLKEDAEAVRTFYESVAQGRRVAWPGELPNFKSSVTDADEMATCTTNAAMCCWPKDRQANDNNGNCAKPYDLNCVDKDPADNTNLCYVDTERGNASTGLDSSGLLLYPSDNNEGEGAIHCHGLAWSNDVNHHTARYKANNLFFVSMYDHMYQRGYVKNIPGAPMCGCVEQMPTVSRSDCTQVDLTETIKITFDGAAFDSRLTHVHVDFNACRGINNRNNDLWAYIARLYYDGDISPAQFGQAGRIITNTGCAEATSYALNEISLTPGYDHDVGTWTNLAGREAMHLHDAYGRQAWNMALTPSDDSENVHHGIIFRACQSCVRTHMKIYYRRLTPIPDSVNLMFNILYETSQRTGNVWNVDFTLHSTYEDAVSGSNPWLCPNNSFNYGATFYGECSPTGARVRNQRSRFHEYFEKNNVAYYGNKAEDEGLQVIETTPIKGRDYAGGVALKADDGTIYMTGSGRDIWSWHDDFNYLSEDAEEDLTVIVHAGDISESRNGWSKSGIMFRSSLETNAAHYSLFLTGGNGICFQGRLTTGSHPQGWGCTQSGAKEAWLKVEKRISTYTSFTGTENGEGDIVWTQVHSRNIPAIEENGGFYRVGLGISSASYWAQEVVFSGYLAESYFFPSASPTVSASPTIVKPVATQSTICHGGVPSRAIDGNTDGHWTRGSVQHTCNESNPWYMLDLGITRIINTVSLYNRQDCCANRLGNTVVQVLDAEMNVVATEQVTNGIRLNSLNFGNVEGRYVKVNKTEYGVLNIAELVVGTGFEGTARQLRG